MKVNGAIKAEKSKEFDKIQIVLSEKRKRGKRQVKNNSINQI
jgi:hypothetical protein